ncbi:MAG: prepilin peptidase [Sphingomonadaceae bacterium]
MLGAYLQYGLLAALAIALLVAAFTDFRSRRIDNWLNAGIALCAPLFWWASGMALWPDIAIQIGITLAAFAVFSAMFAAGWMGGGDVKLLTALALWIEPQWFVTLLLIMAIAGGVLTVMFGAWHVMRRRRDRLAIPYGIAISFGGLWVIFTHYLPIAQQSVRLAG